MKILVIGNGFDLAHGLPTKYNDFLEFLTIIKRMSEYHSTAVDFVSKQLYTSSVNNHIKEYFYKLISRITEEHAENERNANVTKYQKLGSLVSNSEDVILKELIKYLKENIWFKYFIEAQSYINEGWIDFESEISRVIQTLDHYKSKGLFDIENIKDKDIRKFLNGVTVPEGTMRKFDEKGIQKLEEDLNELIRSLEIFLEDCIGRINIEYILPDIQNDKFDKILSFNYTNTYEKVYEPKDNILYDFIHGKASITRTIDTNNMVLGIDEYLDSTQASLNTSFIFYKKYFQRIHKETGCEYKDWIEDIKQSKYGTELYIFGHSLDITDKDVLREIIETEGVITTIFYYNKRVYASQIANLVKVLGVDNLISRVHGYHRSIIFKQQQNSSIRTES